MDVSLYSPVFCWAVLISAVGSVTIGKKMPQITEGTNIMDTWAKSSGAGRSSGAVMSIFVDITVAIGINPVKSSHRAVHGTATGRLWALLFGSISFAFWCLWTAQMLFPSITGITGKTVVVCLYIFALYTCHSGDFCTVALCFHFSCPTKFYVYHILQYLSGYMNLSNLI